MKVSKVVSIGLLVAFTVALAVGISWQGQKSLPQVVVGGSQGVTNYDSLHLSDTGGTATPVLRADQNGTGKIVEFLDGGTPVWSLNDGGEVQSSGALALNGQKLDIDADDDTSMTADTDDQIDWEVGGADIFVMKEWGASAITTDTTEYLFEIMDTTNVMTAGTNSLAALDIDLGIGNSTAGTNTVYGILIDGITQDAQNTETAIAFGSGWDSGLDAGTNTIVNVGNAGTDFDSNGGLTTASTITVTAGGLVVSAGGADVAGGSVTLSNDEQINNSTDGFIGFVGGQLWSTTTTTATNGSTITPTVYTVYNLDTSAEVTITLGSCTEGGPLIIAGDDANNININDTNIRSEDGAASVIGQYDIQLWFCVDQEWLLVAESTNS